MGGTTMFTNPLKSILTITLFVAVAFAQTFSVQGVLRDPVGRTVEDGAYSMTFKIYDQEVGGTALWTETHATIDIAHGVYVVELGTVTSMSGLTFGSQYYIGISVEGGQELEPRMKLSNSPTTMAVLGVDNVFPSSGNVGVGTADPQAGLDIITQNTDDDLLKITSSGGENRSVRVDNEGNLIINSGSVIQFASDGTSLASADFGGSATALSTPGDANITADALNEGTGNINFKIADATKATIDHDGNTGFTGDVTTTGEISAATLTAPSVSATNLSTGTITATGEISAATLTAPSVSATNLTASGDATITGDVTSANVNTGTVTATGDVTAPNIMTKLDEFSFASNRHEYTIDFSSYEASRFKVIYKFGYVRYGGDEDYLALRFNDDEAAYQYSSVTYGIWNNATGDEASNTSMIMMGRSGFSSGDGHMSGEFTIDNQGDDIWPTVNGLFGWNCYTNSAWANTHHFYGTYRYTNCDITSMTFYIGNDWLSWGRIAIYALP